VPGLRVARVSRIPHADLDLHLEVGETRPARALERALRDAIVAGRVATGARLPASRGLAADLGIARTTVSEVYAQLAAEGWLESRVGAGTWVAETAPAAPGQAEADAAEPDGRLRPYSGGYPDASLFPRAEWAAAARRAADGATLAELGYPDPRGSLRLRRELASYLRRTRGADASAERIVIGQGFSGLLALTCRAMTAAGARRLAIEEYGHRAHREIAAAAGLELVPVPVDGEGADVTRLGPGIDGVLLTPAHQFPTGVPLSPPRRRAVIAWAQATGGLVIEDDYDGEFRYERRAVGALQAMAPDHVAYIGTASKALTPAVGLAWAVLPKTRLAGVIAQRSVLSEPRDALNQLTLAEFVAAHSASMCGGCAPSTGAAGSGSPHGSPPAFLPPGWPASPRGSRRSSSSPPDPIPSSPSRPGCARACHSRRCTSTRLVRPAIRRRATRRRSSSASAARPPPARCPTLTWRSPRSRNASRPPPLKEATDP
jgi:GntR family transcriptional regulator / MocR family aminotransferase